MSIFLIKFYNWSKIFFDVTFSIRSDSALRKNTEQLQYSFRFYYNRCKRKRESTRKEIV